MSTEPTTTAVDHFDNAPNTEFTNRIYPPVEIGTELYAHPTPTLPLTPREIELIDGMIAVQLDHAQRCDKIGNRVMAERQKYWDMERVELLRRIRSIGITAQAKKEGA